MDELATPPNDIGSDHVDADSALLLVIVVGLSVHELRELAL